MGQKERARDLVHELFEFTTSTTHSPAQVIDLAVSVADASSSKVLARIRPGTRGVLKTGGEYLELSARGPGGVVQLMAFDIFAEALPDGGSTVKLKVGDFLFQKGSLGMKPSINAKPVMQKYVTALYAQLSA